METQRDVMMDDLWNYTDTPVKTMLLDGIKIPYRVERRSIKNTRLEFDKGQLWIFLSRRELNEKAILLEKKRWVLKHYLKLKQRLEVIKKWHGKNQIMVLGGPFTFVNYIKGRGARVDFGQKIIHMNWESSRHKTRVKNLLKKRFRDELNNRLKTFSEELRQEPVGFRIKNQRTSWGSCSSKRNLNFNLRLIFLPPQLIDYVVFHEMLHLRYMSHGKRFHAVMKRKFGDVKRFEDELANWWHYTNSGVISRLI
ncbi:MAG: M48 family metallopeptidase [Candidatus Altiarchaeota archaeon]|nr:M48 family metallopeptidase [Candidatus Altiarchaeota archaeon]